MNARLPQESVLPRRDWLKRAAVATAAVTAGTRLRGGEAKRELTEAQREALRGVLEEAVAKRVIPGGSLVVLSRGRVALREAVGFEDFERTRAFSAEAPVAIASVSKPIAATFFALLDERGIVRLDDAVEKFLPEFRGLKLKSGGDVKGTLRVWHLLSHRSGMPGNADMGDARPHRLARQAGAAAEEAGLDISLEQVTRRWVTEGLFAEPGARFAYGSAGYMVAARIAEVVLGKRFERLLAEELLEPLGMTRTTFHPTEETRRAMPARYASTPNGPQRDTRTMPLPAPDGLINPAGGLISRVDELASFLALHARRGLAGEIRLAGAETLARMYRPHPPRATEAAEGGGVGYGLGWNVVAPGGAARHLGASGTMVWLDLRREHAGALVTQVKWGAGNRPMIARLMREVHRVFGE